MKVTMQEEPDFLAPTQSVSKSLKSFLKDLSLENFENFIKEVSQAKNPDFEDVSYEIKQFRVQLDADPPSIGVGTLNLRLQQVQSFKDRLAFIMTDTLSIQSVWDELLFVAKKFYKYNYDNLMVQKYIRDLPNQDIRKAEVDKVLKRVVATEDHCKFNVDKIKMFLNQCDIVYNNMKSTNDNISRQITVVGQQIEIREISR